jgi:hypothetical protein
MLAVQKRAFEGGNSKARRNTSRQEWHPLLCSPSSGTWLLPQDPAVAPAWPKCRITHRRGDSRVRGVRRAQFCLF